MLIARNILNKLYEGKELEPVIDYLISKYYDKETGKFTINVEDRLKTIVPENEVDEAMTELNKKVSEMGTEATEVNSEPQKEQKGNIPKEVKEIGNKIVKILKNYNVKCKFKDAEVGPRVTQYEFELAPGTKISDVSNLSKEIAMGLAVKNVSVEQVEGKTTVGIQVPNTADANVDFDEVMQNSEKSGVSVVLGKDMNGNSISGDILKMQHVLIGGSTGSGKSSAINSIICSLIQQYSPEQVKLVLIDPKRVELSAYANDPHLLLPIVTDSEKAAETLEGLVKEMDSRYSTFEKVKVKNIEGYNNLVDKYNANGNNAKLMPYIVCVIDELADLMMTAGKSVEASIQRLTQLSRAAGIHLIVATQRPSVDVVTGTIKSNIASRIAFTTASGVDSKTILDQGGAEKLLGKGDMLYKPMGSSNAKRIQGAYISDDEVEKIVSDSIDKYGSRQQEQPRQETDTVEETDAKENKEEKSDMYQQVVDFVKQNKKISTSDIQLQFRIPYSEAKSYIDKMEEDGIIRGQKGTKPRKVTK